MSARSRSSAGRTSALIGETGEIKAVGDRKFVLMAGEFVNINDLHIDLIDQVNPFQKAFEILSKSVTKQCRSVSGQAAGWLSTD